MAEPILPDPIWISTPGALRRLVADLAGRPILAVDTESNGLHAYQEQVCLIQISTGEADYLIDPLALSDLSPLEPIFADPGVEKVFHAAEYDILCLKRDFGFRFAGLFDTMVAGRILGRTEIGLGSMLAVEFGVALNKRYQRANWGRRPLPAAMLTYARLDSHYLIALRDLLSAELQARGLTDLAHEDFQRLAQIPAAPLDAAPPNPWWKLAGSQELTPQQAGILHELSLFRDRQARYSNQPPFRILSNENLLDLALCASVDLDLEGLCALNVLPDSLVERYGEGILEAVRRGAGVRPPQPPVHVRPSHAVLHRMQMLQQWRKDTGRRLGVESDVILPRDVLNEIAQHNPFTPQELAEVMPDLPWRREHFGLEILTLLHPKGKRP